MEEGGGGGGLVVLDGELLRSLDPPPFDGAVTGAQIMEAVDSAAVSALFGVQLPEEVKSAALGRMGTEGFRSAEFEAEAVARKAREYLKALADQLRDEPLIISVLDGSALRLFLDDEDDFAMLAENLFTDLDINDTGKLSKSKIRNALELMGVDMGVPPFSESNDLLTVIMKKHGVEGEEELGQAQFAQLLQPVLQDIADALAENHVTVIQNIVILNGSKLRKILADENYFDGVIEKMYQEWDNYGVEEENREKLRGFLESKGQDLGLPSPKSNEAIVFLYDQIFNGVKKEQIDGELRRDSFQEVVKYVLEKFAEQLEATPIFVVPDS